MKNRLKALDYAKVMSTFAVFIALGGTSYAAAKITGATVKDGTLSGKDVRDRSLGAADFRPGELPAGPPGPQGPAGAPGAGGAGDVLATAIPRRGLTQGEQTLISVPLPAGNWVVTAGGLIDNTSATNARSARCQIRLGSELVGDSGVLIAGPNDGGPSGESFTRTGVARSNGTGDLILACSASASTVFLDQGHLVAVEAGSLETDPAD